MATCRKCKGTGKHEGAKCKACGGKVNKCKECDGQGEIDIECCPLLIIERDVWEVLKYAELYRNGLPPVTGGALDQADSFIAAADYIFDQEQGIKNQLGIIG